MSRWCPDRFRRRSSWPFCRLFLRSPELKLNWSKIELKLGLKELRCLHRLRPARERTRSFWLGFSSGIDKESCTLIGRTGNFFTNQNASNVPERSPTNILCGARKLARQISSVGKICGEFPGKYTRRSYLNTENTMNLIRIIHDLSIP